MFLALRWDQWATDKMPRELPRLDWVAPRPTARMDYRRVEGAVSTARSAFGANHPDTALPDRVDGRSGSEPAGCLRPATAMGGLTISPGSGRAAPAKQRG